MGVPALLVDFPRPGAPDYSERAKLLGRQWPVFWKVGNNFFRPISTLGIFGYAFSAYAASKATAGGVKGDWRIYAVAAVCHLTNVVHSAINMQPLNEKIEALSGSVGEKHEAMAVELAETWIQRNYVRIVCPLIAGTLALFQTAGIA
ncbi:hypothetical protein K402DRAFT_398314 [Aulographum hederae CBS 113979]|uniref:DUF1772-domain-containing protein n=1 Tax=Aulographum hederae CBS 113979 TaxID=1176131 RepID=A0A6G1GL36_9PEZI|nr:hypothetical protein K402DRAFT_398314 [Aulographum hederae CBS 113979]